MDGKNWTWHEDGRVTLKKPGPEGGEDIEATFRRKECAEREIATWLAGMGRAREISMILSEAAASFKVGMASYVNAYERLSELLDSIGVAVAESKRVARGVERFFDPPAIDQFVGGNGEIVLFAKEAMERMGV